MGMRGKARAVRARTGPMSLTASGSVDQSSDAQQTR
jgi:hypothetical protein